MSHCAPSAAIILAAGASTRLGQAKQQLFIGDKTLLQRAALAALEAGCTPVIVVLGAAMKRILPDLQDYPVTIAENPFWQDGMGSSINAGMRRLMEIAPGAEGLVLMVCDQPAVDGPLLKTLISLGREGAHDVAACEYAGTLGVPAYFRAAVFPELLALNGQEGAKKLLSANSALVSRLAFPEGATDIDTEADFLAWNTASRSGAG